MGLGNIKTKKIIKKNFLSTINDIPRTKKDLFIFGNGPSLSASLEKIKSQFVNFDCIAVNHFCETSYYEEIKPNLYFLADPAFFGNIKNYSNEHKTKIENFIDTIINKTTWNLNLIVPSDAHNTFFEFRIRENKNINMYFYNNKNFGFYNTKEEKFFLYNQNLITPPAQTVINTAIYYGIFKKYSNIYIFGADTTWIEQIKVDQETNNIYTIDKHFYGETKRLLYKDTEWKIPIKLHEELRSIAIALENYWELKEYSLYNNVKIFNASEYSLIDAFDRRKISDIL